MSRGRTKGTSEDSGTGMNKFGLCPDASGGFDFLIDGQFLRQLVFEKDGLEQYEVTLLRRRKLLFGAARDQIRRLKGELPGEFFPHRVWLYFCGECFGEGCGGVSVNVRVGTDDVIWSDFHHDGPSGSDNDLDEVLEEDRIASVGPFVFDRSAYEAALNNVADQLGRSRLRYWISTAPLSCTPT